MFEDIINRLLSKHDIPYGEVLDVLQTYRLSPEGKNMNTEHIQATCLQYLESEEGSQDSPLFFQFYALFPPAPETKIAAHADKILDHLAQSSFDRLSDTGEISWLYYILVVAPHMRSRVLGLLKDIEQRVIRQWLKHPVPPQREIILYVLTHLVFVSTLWGTRKPGIKFEQTTLNLLNKTIENPPFRQKNGGFRYVEPHTLFMELILASIYLGTRYRTTAMAERALRDSQRLHTITTHTRQVMFELFHVISTSLSTLRGDTGARGQRSGIIDKTNKSRLFLYHHTAVWVLENGQKNRINKKRGQNVASLFHRETTT